jgi:ATP-dependent DNA helicase RecG
LCFLQRTWFRSGTIVLGVTRDETSLFPSYIVEGIENPDKLQADLASQTASLFNQPVRPEIEVETLSDKKVVIKIQVSELPDGQKPLYLKNPGLPKGAFRRGRVINDVRKTICLFFITKKIV